MKKLWWLVNISCVTLLSMSTVGASDGIPHQKVIIVGAGISGFAAASKLLENNISSFVIMEAEDRVGGRINSVQLGQGFVDIGAEFIHGEQGNSVFELAKEYLTNDDGELPGLYSSSSGELNNSMLLDFFQVLHEFEKHPGSPAETLSGAFTKKYNSEILQKYGERKKLAGEFKRVIERIFLSLEGSFDWHELRSKFHNFVVYPGNPLQSWSGMGFKTIFEVLKNKIGEAKTRILDSKIHLNKTVVKIMIRNDERNILVECHDGTKFTADHLIFTASLGVLKHDHTTIFQPKLDEKKVEAIEALGIGGIMKIAVTFTEDWWKHKKDAYLVWNEEDEQKLPKEVPYGPSKNGEHWLSGFHCLAPAPKNPTVLIAWIAGHLVPEVEQMPADELKQGLMYGIRKFFGANHNVSDPINMVRSQWCTNPHFRGTFSYETLDTRNMHSSSHLELLQPVKDVAGVPRIFFAGEATHPTRFSTADGALSSGFMQAEKIMVYLNGQ